jgi:hypothetical protein
MAESGPDALLAEILRKTRTPVPDMACLGRLAGLLSGAELRQAWASLTLLQREKLFEGVNRSLDPSWTWAALPGRPEKSLQLVKTHRYMKEHFLGRGVGLAKAKSLLKELGSPDAEVVLAALNLTETNARAKDSGPVKAAMLYRAKVSAVAELGWIFQSSGRRFGVAGPGDHGGSDCAFFELPGGARVSFHLHCPGEWNFPRISIPFTELSSNFLNLEQSARFLIGRRRAVSDWFRNATGTRVVLASPVPRAVPSCVWQLAC